VDDFGGAEAPSAAPAGNLNEESATGVATFLRDVVLARKVTQ
jgi:hypothetical protein